MIKHAVMFLLLAALLVNYCSSAAHCGLTPTTLEDDYITSCNERLGNDYYCKGMAWKAFSESFGSKKPEDITERCERKLHSMAQMNYYGAYSIVAVIMKDISMFFQFCPRLTKACSGLELLSWQVL